ncbi:MAG TPA: SsrA-binding protein SmpB [Candidatus Kapabacteria bacterium]|jgi:SsrA-binding protein|nr:SsrA-binding protein SmpB [Candidatus Kapabacteria bacterium]HPU23422.1 SsrA-binding protein SmpB [Candidatus Kapabacteria bacterium]
MKSAEILNREVKIIANNRKARHDFIVLQSIECGIVLSGTEVKSLRQSKCSLQEAYATFQGEDLYLVNFHIAPYEHGNRENHEPKRPRKLLIHKREAFKLKSAVAEKGVTLIPLSIYFSGHLVKVEIGLCRSKKKYDKRETTKKRETEREIQRKYKV